MASLNQTHIFRLIFLLIFGTSKATYYHDSPSIQCRPLKFVPSSYSFSEQDDPQNNIPNLAPHCDVPKSKTTASNDFYDNIVKAENRHQVVARAPGVAAGGDLLEYGHGAGLPLQAGQMIRQQAALVDIAQAHANQQRGGGGIKETAATHSSPNIGSTRVLAPIAPCRFF